MRRWNFLFLFLPLSVLLSCLVTCRSAPEPVPPVRQGWGTLANHRPTADWIRAEAEPEGQIVVESYADQVFVAVRRHYKEFQACYQAALQVDPDLYGELSLVFRIGRDGHVGAVKVDFSTLQSPALEPCVLDVFGRLVLPPPPRADMKVRYPFLFTSERTPPEIMATFTKHYHLEREPAEGGREEAPRDDYDAPW